MMLVAGKSLGKYTILREVGRGGMGVVFLAEDGTLGRRVALKVLHSALGGDADFVERFRREARAVAGLYHPNILRVHALEALEGGWAIETEYVEAGSLSDAMAGRGVSAFEAVRLVYEVLGALARCHAEGIVHRDVKPSNILIGAEGQALLADFGLAKALAEASEESVAARRSSALFVGTPCYAPLEAWDGEAPSQSWDVYAAGMVLYETLTGVMPFDGETVLKVMRQKANVVPVPVRELAPHVSAELSALVGQMISADARVRPESAMQARELLEGVPELSTPAPVNRRTVAVTRRPSQRLSASLRRVKRKWVLNAPWIAGASLLALALLVPLGWWAASAGMLGSTPRERSGPAPFASAEEVLAQVGPGSEGIVMDVVEHESGTRTDAAWWIGPEGEKGERMLIAQGPMTLWSATLRAEGGVAQVGGHWAAYVDAEGLVLRHGALSGTGSWGKPGEAVSLTITFTSERDGKAETLTFTGTKRGDAGAARRFLYDVEGQPGVPALLVKDLLPRKLPWATALEERMPGLWHERATAPFEAGVSSATVDGKLEETFWSKQYALGGNEAGLLLGRAEGGKAELSLRRDAERLLLGVRLAQRPTGRARVSLFLMPLAVLPVGRSPRVSAVWLAGELVDSKTEYAAAALAPPAYAEAAASPAGWTAECGIAFAENVGAPLPDPEARWRIALHIDDVREDGSAVPIAAWGCTDLADIPHGAVLTFGTVEKGAGT